MLLARGAQPQQPLLATLLRRKQLPLETHQRLHNHNVVRMLHLKPSTMIASNEISKSLNFDWDNDAFGGIQRQILR